MTDRNYSFFDDELKITKKVKVNGVLLHCIIFGSGPNPILCIPGAMASCEWCFTEQLKYFGRQGSDFTVVAYDPRGYGYSSTQPRAYNNFPEHHQKTDARDAHELMQSLGYSKFSVLGWCDGGIVSIHLYALFPVSVLSIVIWGTRPYLTESDLKIAESITKNIVTAKVGELNKILRASLNVYGSVDAMQAVWENYSESLRNIYHDETKNGEICGEAEIRKVKCPSLVIHGSKDTFTSQSHIKYIANNIANSKLVIFDAGKHAIQLDNSENFNSTVESFFTTQH